MLYCESRVWNFKHCSSTEPKKLELPHDKVQKERGTYADRAGSNSMHSVRDFYLNVNKTKKK
jgi:hypothetical protein